MPRPKKSDKTPKGDVEVPFDTIQIAEVVWIDAEEIGDIGWNSIRDMLRSANKSCPQMITIGYVVMSDDDQIALMNTIGPAECSRLDKIPMGMVQRLTIMRDGITLTEYVAEKRKR